MAVENKKMQQRRDTAANWTAANPVLAAGEIGWESDTDQFKIGDGVNAWVDIVKYYTTGSSGLVGSTGSTDNAVLRADGTGGSTVQASTVTIDDTGIITAAGTPTFATAGGGLNIGSGGAAFAIASGGSAVQMQSTTILQWANTTNAQAAADTALIRSAAGQVAITDGSTGGGGLLMREITAPASPAANSAIIYVADNGSGTTVISALFSSGAAQQVPTGSTGATDNAVLRANGTGGAAVQASVMTIDDNGTVNIPDGQSYQLAGTSHVVYSSGTGTSTFGNPGVTRTDITAATNIFIKIGAALKHLFTSTLFLIDTAAQLVWGTAGVDGGDTGLGRFSAGVIKSTNASTAITGFMGGGGSIASATALPLPTGRVFHVTGTTAITSITATNLASGVVITLIFDDVLTFTDGNNLKLAGNFVTSADDTITLAYDGSNFYEITRSVN